jgi:hypothetical protein
MKPCSHHSQEGSETAGVWGFEEFDPTEPLKPEEVELSPQAFVGLGETQDATWSVSPASDDLCPLTEVKG